MPPGRNEDCLCGSGKKYKHCHYDIDRAPDEEKYAVAQRIYATNWKITSQSHFNNGVYHWLAEQLADYSPKRILDIGCGSGHGLVALRDVFGADISIVALDENRTCLQAAKDILREKQGIDAELVTRMSVSLTAHGYAHEVDSSPLVLENGSPCVLIESDICNDPYLSLALRSLGPIDAVTIWQSGTHMMRYNNVNVRKQGIDSETKHRLYVQNATYELADEVLRTGGVLQVSDRGEMPDTDILREDFLASHRDQASVTSLEVQSHSLACRPYSQPNARRTPMSLIPGTSRRMPIAPQLAVLSIISQKLHSTT